MLGVRLWLILATVNVSEIVNALGFRAISQTDGKMTRTSDKNVENEMARRNM